MASRGVPSSGTWHPPDTIKRANRTAQRWVRSRAWCSLLLISCCRMTPLCGLLLAFSKVAECSALIIGCLGLVHRHVQNTKNRARAESEWKPAPWLPLQWFFAGLCCPATKCRRNQERGKAASSDGSLAYAHPCQLPRQYTQSDLHLPLDRRTHTHMRAHTWCPWEPVTAVGMHTNRLHHSHLNHSGPMHRKGLSGFIFLSLHLSA